MLENKKILKYYWLDLYIYNLKGLTTHNVTWSCDWLGVVPGAVIG